MGLFSANHNDSNSNAARADERAARKARAQIAEGRRRGVNYTRVADVKQRHSTGTGRDGRVIRGIFG